MANVLIIDDDKTLCRLLKGIITGMNHQATCAGTLDEGLREVRADVFDVVFLDVGLPDGNGLDVLPTIQQNASRPEVVIITGNGDPDGAETAIQNGAWDYLQKPLSYQKAMLSLRRVLQFRNGSCRGGHGAVSLKLDNIVGSSPPMRCCYDSLAKAANSDASVLISGETGTGKELFAHAIHTNSSRAEKNFVVVDCAALPETLVESIIFGHEKGAFTGADKSQKGLIQQADGGTLFLDEVGELPLSVQGAFLRVLQEKRFRTIGGQKEIEIDFRLVVATNQNLDQMVQATKFRQDLLYRLRSINIELPPLRNRDGDIKELVIFYVTRLCERYGIGTKGFSKEFFETLSAYSWPGNVRELINAVENIIATAGDDPLLFPQHLPKRIRAAIARAAIRGHAATGSMDLDTQFSPLEVTLKSYRDAVVKNAEKKYLHSLMSFVAGNIQKSCRLSGLSRPRLYALLKKHQIARFN